MGASNPWTFGQFIHMSQSLAEAYGNVSNNKTQGRRGTRWTLKRLADSSAAMACLLK